MVLYSDWKLHVLMVTGAVFVGAAAEPYAVVFVHPPAGGEHEVQAIVVTQQLLAVPHAAVVFQCR